jgi:hypothetical protein
MKKQIEALKKDEALIKFFADCGFDIFTFIERYWQIDNDCYLLLKTAEGAEHNRLQDQVDKFKTKRHISQVPEGNTFDLVYVGNAKIMFFPRAGECQVRYFQSDSTLKTSGVN